MFGRGLKRLQPAYVQDVAEAIARPLQRAEMHAITFEGGGPRVYSYEELLKTVTHEASLKPMFIPIPFAAWHVLAWFAEMLPNPPVTRNRVELMQVDNVSSLEMLGFGQLDISPHSVEEILQQMLWSRRSRVPRFENERSCMLKQRLRQALTNQAQTGTLRRTKISTPART